MRSSHKAVRSRVWARLVSSLDPPWPNDEMSSTHVSVPTVVVLAGPERCREVPAGRAARTPGPPPRRLLQGRRRPDAAPHHRRRQRRPRRLGPPRRPGTATTPLAALERAVPRRVARGAGLRDRPERPLRLPASLDLGGSRLLRGGGHLRARRWWPACRDRGHARGRLLRHASTRLVTFWRRLTRDLREHRKPPARAACAAGCALLRDQQRVVAHAVRQGCRRATGDQAYAELTADSSAASR